MKPAAWLFGLASCLAGLLDLVWREFEPAHQPIQAWIGFVPGLWSERIPGLTFMAIIAAVWLIVAGLALFIHRLAPAGAEALAILYGVFCLFPMPRLITAPHYLGHTPGIYVGVFVGVFQQVILFVGAACLWLLLTQSSPNSKLQTPIRWLFGVACIDFGLAHFFSMALTAAMIPAWMPLGGVFWTIVSGVGFILAGLAFLTRIQEVLAARLLTVMLLLFSLLVLTPRALAAPHEHVAWGGDAYNLTAAGAAWIFAVWLREQGAGLSSGASRSAIIEAGRL